MHRAAARTAVVIALACPLLVTPGSATAVAGGTAAGTADAPIAIATLSSRADLVAGPDALVAITAPKGTPLRRLRITLRSQSVARAFHRTGPGRFQGLVTGLRPGRDVLRATRRSDGSGAALTITDHPWGGPLFAGPQVRPWTCTTQSNGLGPATDAQCDAPPVYSYEYRSSLTGQFAPYDPSHPPADVATTTTDQGRRVPFIVRVEKGAMDRGIYEIAVLDQPGTPPATPPADWDGKLEVSFGGGCGVHHAQADYGIDSTPLDPNALARGYAVAAGGLFTTADNCDEVVSAEALTMLKEHIIESYGPIRFMVGQGCSGGAIQQENIAAEYPGLLDGLQVNCSYPDSVTLAQEAVDCGLVEHYDTTTLGGLLLTAQRGAIEGHANLGSSCIVDDIGLFPLVDPTGRSALASPGVGTCAVPENEVYDPVTNPHGVRCDYEDYQSAIWGINPATGFANLPFDNVGVQYGLSPLLQHAITPQQFADLNAGIGGITTNGTFQVQRTSAPARATVAAYRAGRVSDGRELATVPIIDLRGQDNFEAHQDFYSYVTRARLDADAGGHGNQIIWTGPIPLFGSPSFAARSLDLIDRWVTRIRSDRSRSTAAAKVVRDKPADAVDACWIAGLEVTDMSTCRAAYPVASWPRGAAGEPMTDDNVKCQLKPLARADYPGIMFTGSQWQELQRAFPSGVCDWSRPAVDQQPVQTWTTYPSLQPLPPPPHSVIIPVHHDP